MLKLTSFPRFSWPLMVVLAFSFTIVSCGDSDEEEKRKKKEKAAAEERAHRTPEQLAIYRVQTRFGQVKAQMDQMESDLKLLQKHHEALRADLRSIYDELQTAELKGFRFSDMNTTEILAIQAQQLQREINNEEREDNREDVKEEREEEENRVLTTVIILILLLSLIVFFAKIFLDRKNQAPAYPVAPRDAMDSPNVDPVANDQNPLQQDDEPDAPKPPLT